MGSVALDPASDTPNASSHVTQMSPDLVSQHIHPTTEMNDDSMLDIHVNTVLTPPTSEDMDKKDGVASDLSDEEDDDWEIEPDHYWDGGKIPVFKPTMRQFRDFEKCIEKIDKYGMKSGIVKVIPPQEWRDAQPNLAEAVKQIRVKNPITQEFHGTYGTYTQANIEKQRSYNLPQWKNLTQETNHQPPARRGERRGAPGSATKAKPTRSAAAASPAAAKKTALPLPPGVKRGRGRPRKNPLPIEPSPAPSAMEEADLNDVPPTPTSPSHNVEAEEEDMKIPVKDEPIESIETKPAKRKPGRQPGQKYRTSIGATKSKPGPKPKGESRAKGDAKTSVSSRRLNNRTDAFAIDEAAFEGFDYHMQDLDQFSSERCKELEDVYWKTINYGSPMYGADMPGSLFDDRTQCWNVAKLPNLLDALGTKVPGVNTAYLYLGMWKATFAWHLEDVDLYSINYIHFGAPKQWYSISQEDARRFEAAMKTLWPNDAKHCDQFLRHKTYLISPDKLKSQFNITVNRLVHYEGEFVITYPYGYHSGFNIGYNCAESVNFANESWLNYGRMAKKCECESDSVWVDVNEIERKLRGEPTPEYYEVTDDEEDGHLPSPPPSESAKRGRKRKRDQKDTPQKKKKIKIRIRTAAVEPCVLCPNDVTFDTLLPTDVIGKMAHRMCAMYTPETFLVVENGVEIVCNVAGISKARLELRCMHCRSKKGSCFQCSSKKCHRAFHATCAAPAGVQIDTGVVPTWDEDGTEYYCEGYDFRCRFHRPRRPKHTDSESLEKSALIMAYGESLKAGSAIQAQSLDGEVFAGVVAWNQPGERSLIVDVIPDGDRVEVEWKYLLVLDPADSLRPKPSHDAKPLPAHLLRKPADVSAKNRKDGVPSEGDPFLDPTLGQKWAEFHTATSLEIRNPAQTKVNFNLPEQCWHYLGRTSTEAKPHYTHDVRVSVNNPRSAFLDTVRPSPAPYPPRLLPPLQHSSSSPTPAQRHAQAAQPRSSNKNYSYKPRPSMAPYGQSNQYGPNSPWHQHPNPAAYERTIAPQQMHNNYYSSAPSQPQPQSQLLHGLPVQGPQLPPVNSRRVSSAATNGNGNKKGKAPATSVIPQPYGSKPIVTPIDTNCAATPVAQPPKQDNSPPNPNYYAQAEQRYASNRVQEYHKRLMELTASASDPSTPASSNSTPGTQTPKPNTPPYSHSVSSSLTDAIAFGSLRNVPPGSLPHSPNLTHMPFTPPSKRIDIKDLVRDNDDPVLIRHRRNSSMSKSLLTKPRSAYVSLPKFSEQKPPAHLLNQDRANISTTPLGSPQMAVSPLLNSTSSAAHTQHQPLNYHPFDNSRNIPHNMYQTNEQFNANMSASQGPKLTRFDEFMRQLNGQASSGASASSINGSSHLHGNVLNGIPQMPAISAEQMDILRDSIVFTPPPEAQKAHAAKLAARSSTPIGGLNPAFTAHASSAAFSNGYAHNGNGTNGSNGSGPNGYTNGHHQSANMFDTSPERPTYSPLSDNGRK